MTARKPLRAVSPDDVPPTKRRLTISEAAEAGQDRELLVAMRARLAKSVDDPNCPPRDLAALTRRLQDINRDIQALDAAARQEAAENGDVPDEAFDASAI